MEYMKDRERNELKSKLVCTITVIEIQDLLELSILKYTNCKTKIEGKEKLTAHRLCKTCCKHCMKNIYVKRRRLTCPKHVQIIQQ